MCLSFTDEGKMTTPEMDERFLSNLWKKIMNSKPRPQTEVLDEQYENYLDEDEDLFYLSCVVLSLIAFFGILSAYYCLVKKNMLNILPEDGLLKAEEGRANDDNSSSPPQ
ncbi:hypothetical protein XELAEV_18031869mg [Xenopus laevis]|uniref:Uncharacterized protein n=1 Tax=Xenopus laevis TaxID=8355 RepID=A0A974HG56_XENLA|nr:hypothetical protein XELAEV_18031869mg [Xenopus laevis]